MRKFAMIVFTTAFVGFAAGTAMGQQTVACDGLESTGTGAVDATCGPALRDYAYPVTDTAGNMTDVYIGTEDNDLANYTALCMPAGWVMTIEANAPPAPPFAGAPLMHSAGLVKTAHGGGSPGPVPACPMVIHFSGPAGLPGGAFTFGFDHAAPSHDVEWQTINGGAPFFSAWGAPVGNGFGPVHAPREAPVGACCADHCEGCPCVITTRKDCEGDKSSVYYGNGSTCDPNPCDPKPGGVPTVSGWGLVVVTMLAVVAGTIMLNRRRRLAA